MSATSTIGQSFSPLLLKANSDTSTHLSPDYGVKDADQNANRRAVIPTPIQRGERGGMMDSQELAIAMRNQQYAPSSSVNAGRTLLGSTGAGHIEFRAPNEEG